MNHRMVSPVESRVAMLILLAAFSSIYILKPSWLGTNIVLFSLPIQRFKWKSENLLSSRLNRYVSGIGMTCALSIFAFTHWKQIGGQWDFGFYEILFLTLALFVLKHYAMKLFFLVHEETGISSVLIDYQSAFNQIITLIFVAFLCADIFYLKGSFSALSMIGYGIVALFIVRLAGSFTLLINHFDRPFLSHFIYLCAFEIAPLLILVKILIL